MLDNNDFSSLHLLLQKEIAYGANSLEREVIKGNKGNLTLLTQNMIKVQNRIYSQLESLSWLQRRLLSKTQLPPLRGWASSPDVLLYLHTHIMQTKPKVVVEFGSGASTLVIADALSQNGEGMLFSIEHSDDYGAQTLFQLKQNCLTNWVDLRISGLVPWDAEHLNPEDASKPSLWYPTSLLADIESVDLIWVDGPPGNTCPYSRYPALPALSNQLSESAEVWMDDTIRQVEKDICEDWAQKYGFDLEYTTLEKGLGRLTRSI